MLNKMTVVMANCFVALFTERQPIGTFQLVCQTRHTELTHLHAILHSDA